MPHSGFIVHEILSGRRRGIGAALARLGLLLLSYPYRLAAAVRNFLYDRNLRAVHSIDRPIVCVGNITAGGTGKTPLVEFLARHYLAAGKKPAIVLRGYAALPGEANDEEKLLAENLPGVPHVAGKDRVACAVAARRKHDADIVLMDDGFQHRRLKRDLDIVTVDATNPFGFGYFLPRGLLRESPKSLARARVVVITRSGLMKPEELASLEDRISRLAPRALVVRAAEEVTGIEDARGVSWGPDHVKGKRVIAFCGVGNPEAFRRTVTGLGVEPAAFLMFDDHQHYTPLHLLFIDGVAGAEKVDVILTTQKDAVKLPDGFQWHHPVLVVRIDVRLKTNEAEFNRLLDEAVTAPAPR